VIPREWRLTPAAFDSPAHAGAPWWGVRADHGGMDTAPAGALIAAAARERAVRFGAVTFWVGGAARDSAARDSTAGAATRP